MAGKVFLRSFLPTSVLLCVTVCSLLSVALTMDDHQEDEESSDTSQVAIRSQLQQCCSALIRIAENLTPPPHQQEVSGSGRVFTEHRSLFRNPISNPASRPRVRRSPYHLPPRPSSRLWTHRFYCLANVGTTSVPSAKPVKEALATAGLGEKSLSIALTSTPSDLHQQLLHLYPSIAHCGGYALLKCTANSKTLQAVQPPPGGHSPISLAAAVGQSRVYIRPLQKDIPIIQQHQVHQAADGPKEACLKCDQLFDLVTLPDHLRRCQGTSSNHSTNSNVTATSSEGSTSVFGVRSSQSTSSSQSNSPNVSTSSSLGSTFKSDDMDDFEPVRVRYRTQFSVGGPSTSRPSTSQSPLTMASVNVGDSKTTSDDTMRTTASSLFDDASPLPPIHLLPPVPPHCEPSTSGLRQEDDEKVALLKEMFPEISCAVFKHMIVDDKLSIETVIDTFVDRKPVKTSDLGRLISQHASKVMTNMDSDVHIKVARSCIWNKAKIFYKAALNDTRVLTKNLVIQFSGEEGLDLGALKKEFFQEVLRSVSRELFEGQTTRLIPKCQWGDRHSMEFQIAGVAIAHSILQGGPGFACLHPALYKYMVYGTSQDNQTCAIEELPSVEDIPQNAATEDLINFIAKLNTTTTQDSIDSLLDEPVNLALLNASGWPSTLRLTLSNKAEFLSGVVKNEVVRKREGAIKSICSGLQELDLLTIIRNHPDVLRKVFVHSPQEFNGECLRALISIDEMCLDEEERTTLEWFWSYVEARDPPDDCGTQASVTQILKFCTGLEEYPPMGLGQPITVEFLKRQQILPQASACFHILKLPCVTSQEEFFFRMDEGVLGSLNHYGTI